MTLTEVMTITFFELTRLPSEAKPIFETEQDRIQGNPSQAFGQEQ